MFSTTGGYIGSSRRAIIKLGNAVSVAKTMHPIQLIKDIQLLSLNKQGFNDLEPISRTSLQNLKCWTDGSRNDIEMKIIATKIYNNTIVIAKTTENGSMYSYTLSSEELANDIKKIVKLLEPLFTDCSVSVKGHDTIVIDYS
jgi:hypothetical protein